MNVNLHIERLILEGLDVSAKERRMFTSAIEEELRQLLKAGGIGAGLQGGGSTARITAPSIQLRRDTGTGQLGKQVAGAIYGGIGSQPKS